MSDAIKVKRKIIRGIQYLIDSDNNAYDEDNREYIGVFNPLTKSIVKDYEEPPKKKVTQRPYPSEIQFTEREQDYYDKNEFDVNKGAKENLTTYWKHSSGQVRIYYNKLQEEVESKRALQMNWDKGKGRPYGFNEDIILDKMKTIKELYSNEIDEGKKANQKRVIAGLMPKLQEARELDRQEVISIPREQEGMEAAEKETRNYNEGVIRERERERRRLQAIEDAKVLLTPDEVKEKLSADPPPSWVTIIKSPFNAVNWIDSKKDKDPYGYNLSGIKNFKYFEPKRAYKVWKSYDLIDPDTLEVFGSFKENSTGGYNPFDLVLNELGEQRLQQYKELDREKEEEENRIKIEEKRLADEKRRADEEAKREAKKKVNPKKAELNGAGVYSLGQVADNISQYDEVYKYSNPKKVQELAKKYLGEGGIIYRSIKKDKKYMVYNPNEKKWVHFGQMKYEDFTKHKDEKRRQSYLKRSANIKGDWKNDKYSPNNLSRNLLWS